jgi:hypothetical protein
MKSIYPTPAQIRAIDTLTQYRVPIKLTEFHPCDNVPKSDWYFRDKHGYWNDISTARLLDRYCPYRVGDVLAVKETWLPDPPDDDTWDYCLYTDGVYFNMGALPDHLKNPAHVIYKASWDGCDLRWRSPVTMPAWAVRHHKTVTEIGVEWLPDISEEDCIKNGFTCEYPVTAKTNFLLYWENNKYPAVPWESWVWKLTLKVEEK